MHFPEMNNDQKRDLFAECLLDTQGYTFNEKNTAAFYRERDPTSLEKPEEKKALLTLMSELISTL